MRTTFRLFLLVTLLLAGFAFAPTGPAQAEAPYPTCLGETPKHTGTSAENAQWFICVPPVWNGILVIYAHGYESPVDPANRKVPAAPTFANLTNPVDETYLPDLLLSQGFDFGATTYRRTGLVAADGVEDVAAVAAIARATFAQPPARIYVAGVSEGGLVTTLTVERHPELVDGGLAACGPIGDFQEQINYFGDFRTLYDYFFPDIVPGNTTNIPTAPMMQWPKFNAKALDALSQNPGNALQLMKTSQAAFDPLVPETAGSTTSEVLWYNVFSMMNAKDVLGGNPFGNEDREYSGLVDNTALNAGVRRYKASPTALDNVRAYQTTGQLAKPLVTLHTTLDPVVPYWHEGLYKAKVVGAGKSDMLTEFPIVGDPDGDPPFGDRYGHCNFTSAEIMGAFGVLLAQ
jgi:pimeloyl-ACP methyl ester carboxylesterase